MTDTIGAPAATANVSAVLEADPALRLAGADERLGGRGAVREDLGGRRRPRRTSRSRLPT